MKDKMTIEEVKQAKGRLYDAIRNEINAFHDRTGLHSNVKVKTSWHDEFMMHPPTYEIDVEVIL